MIKDNIDTLKAGLKAEQDTIVEYTKYLNMAKQAGNASEVKLWEHIIKDEQEHVKEFENALKGDFTLLDDVTTVRVLSQEETNKRNQQIEEFEDDIIDCLSDAGIKHGSYSLSNEWPHFYVDFDYREDDAIAAYNALSDCLFKCDLVDDDGFYYVHILRR